MRLTNLKVTNHKRLADLDIEIREHLVLVGANDVGKSSLIRDRKIANKTFLQLMKRLGYGVDRYYAKREENQITGLSYE